MAAEQQSDNIIPFPTSRREVALCTCGDQDQARAPDPAIVGIARLLVGPAGSDPDTIAWAAGLFARLCGIENRTHKIIQRAPVVDL